VNGLCCDLAAARSALPRSTSASNGIPWAESISFKTSFSPVKFCTICLCCCNDAFAAVISEAYASLNRDTSVSRLRMYCSLRSRCVLQLQSIHRWDSYLRGMVPLRLAIQLLPSGRSRSAVGLWASSFRRLALCGFVNVARSTGLQYKPRVNLFPPPRNLKNSVPIGALKPEDHVWPKSGTMPEAPPYGRLRASGSTARLIKRSAGRPQRHSSQPMNMV
jgi:hypothetical protein